MLPEYRGWNILVTIFSFVIIGYLLVAISPILVFLVVILLLVYLGYVVYSYITNKHAERKQKQSFDESGRRITKVSILEMEDVEEDKKASKKKE